MITKKGFPEMLRLAGGQEPKSFNDFTKITIKNRRLSSATVSNRLKDLIKLKLIEEMITRSKTGRRVISYKTTEKGRKIIELVTELEEAFGTKTK